MTKVDELALLLKVVEEKRKNGQGEKIYISGAVTGTMDYMSRFSRAEEQLKAQGFEVINPAAVNAVLPRSTSYGEYMDMSRLMLSFCRSIYMLNGWEHSCGAKQEFARAVLDGKKIYFEKDGLPEVTNDD